MKILLTGGAGFIGSHVADAYVGAGHKVVIVDDLSSGKHENIPKEVEFIKADVRDRKFMEEVFSRVKPEVVNHHAAQINVRRSVEDPVFDADINILGTLNLLELSVKHKVKRFVFASTGGAIYGEPEKLPADENTLPKPISPYGAAKYAVEVYLGYYKEVHGLNSVCLRYGNVYGPRQDPHGEAGVVAIFCKRILAGETCIIFGDGEQTRDYVFAGDVAKSNVLAPTSPLGIYNIGTEKETSVNGLVGFLREITGRDFNVKYADPRAGEVKKISLDIKLAKKVLNWSPKVDMPEGLRKTWDWFKER